jgi:hypothetical protein
MYITDTVKRSLWPVRAAFASNLLFHRALGQPRRAVKAVTVGPSSGNRVSGAEKGNREEEGKKKVKKRKKRRLRGKIKL